MLVIKKFYSLIVHSLILHAPAMSFHLLVHHYRIVRIVFCDSLQLKPNSLSSNNRYRSRLLADSCTYLVSILPLLLVSSNFTYVATSTWSCENTDRYKHASLKCELPSSSWYLKCFDSCSFSQLNRFGLSLVLERNILSLELLGLVRKPE